MKHISKWRGVKDVTGFENKSALIGLVIGIILHLLLGMPWWGVVIVTLWAWAFLSFTFLLLGLILIWLATYALNLPARLYRPRR